MKFAKHVLYSKDNILLLNSQNTKIMNSASPNHSFMPKMVSSIEKQANSLRFLSIINATFVSIIFIVLVVTLSYSYLSASEDAVKLKYINYSILATLVPTLISTALAIWLVKSSKELKKNTIIAN